MSTYLSLSRLAMAAVILGLVSTASHAALATYTGEQAVDFTVDPFAPPTIGNAVSARQTFLDHLASVVAEESFEGKTNPLSTLFVIGASLTGGGAIETERCDLFGNCTGRFNTTTPGTTWYESETSFTINFGIDNPVSAFGFYLTDFGDFSGSLKLDLDGIPQFDLADYFDSALSTNGSLAFFGFTTDGPGYTSITFNIAQANCEDAPCPVDVIGFDDLVIGSLPTRNSVPEPTTLMLTGIGLLGLAGSCRKQRR